MTHETYRYCQYQVDGPLLTFRNRAVRLINQNIPPTPSPPIL
jgi:hypothetical protein